MPATLIYEGGCKGRVRIYTIEYRGTTKSVPVYDFYMPRNIKDTEYSDPRSER